MPYDLKTPNVPRLTGAKLKLVTSLAEGPLGGLLFNQLAGNMGLFRFREMAADAAPIAPLPVLPDLSRETRPPPDLDALSEEKTKVAGFQFDSVADIRAAYREQTTDPVAVAERAIAAIAESETGETKLRVFFAHDADDVRQQAEASRERWRTGALKGPLDGVPVAIKDEVNQQGYPTTLGTRFLGKSGPAAEDGTAVRKLREAGAILLGKANMTEIGIGPVGLQPHHGTARNPYNPAHFTGGSSAGSGAAVAAGFCPVSLGADGGGSIRNPASFCGVVGLKATFGRVSEYGVPPVCWSVAHLGPLGATARDCALGYALMAGPDPHDRHSLKQPPIDLEKLDDTDLSGIKLGVYSRWFDDCDPDVKTACRKMLAHLQAKGAEIVEIEVEGLDALRVAHMITIASEMLTAQRPHLKSHRSDYSVDVRLLFAAIERFAATDYVHAQRHRAELCAQFDRLLETVDVIVTPTNGCTAPIIKPDALDGESDLSTLSKAMRFVPAANMTGLPAISFPAGYDAQGLPVGFQAMGRAFEESLLLRLAVAAEDGVERQKPQRHWSLLDG